MTHLRKMMLEELERRNYAQTTIDCYIQTIEDFARHFHQPPDGWTPSTSRRVPSVFVPRETAGHVHRDATARGSAVLLHADDQESLERNRYTLPEEDVTPTSILSPEDVAHLIDSSQLGFRRIVLMTLYRAAGLRRVAWLDSTSPDMNKTHGHPTSAWRRSSGPRCHASVPTAKLHRLLVA